MKNRRKKMSSNSINNNNDELSNVLKEVVMKTISVSTKNIIKVIKEEAMRNNTFDIQAVMRFHGMFAIFIGTCIILLPHGFYNKNNGISWVIIYCTDNSCRIF